MRSRRRSAQQGVQYHPALLRPASFIESAIEKLRNSLLIGAVLVVALLLLDAARLARRAGLVQLHSARAADDGLDPRSFGISLNTMTLGGLVVALGVVVDDAVIDVENITAARRRGAGRGRRHRAAVRRRLARSAPARVLRDGSPWRSPSCRS